MSTPFRFLALGDSYTIGEHVAVDQRWPVQLVDALRRDKIAIEDPVIIATTGWTTDELSAGMDQQSPAGTFDVVSLLIGVNNQYRGRDPEEYRKEFRALLQRAIGFAAHKAAHVLVVSIPDWGVTPYAEGKDRTQIGREIDLFNAINKEEAAIAGAAYIDITPISRKAARDYTLTAGDGLHPSGAMYEEWVELIKPVVEVMLGK